MIPFLMAWSVILKVSSYKKKLDIYISIFYGVPNRLIVEVGEIKEVVVGELRISLINMRILLNMRFMWRGKREIFGISIEIKRSLFNEIIGCSLATADPFIFPKLVTEFMKKELPVGEMVRMNMKIFHIFNDIDGGNGFTAVDTIKFNRRRKDF